MRHCDVSGRESDLVLLDGYLISYFQTGLRNLLDRAILDSTDFHARETVEKYRKLDELPFDFNRRMMSVLVRDPQGRAVLLTKGPRRNSSCAVRTLSLMARCPQWTQSGSWT